MRRARIKGRRLVLSIRTPDLLASRVFLSQIRMMTAPEGEMSKKTIHFEFTQGLVKEPLLYLLARKFDVVTNIRAASVTDEGGFVVLEVEGEDAIIQQAVDYLSDEGIKVTIGDE